MPPGKAPQAAAVSAAALLLVYATAATSASPPPDQQLCRQYVAESANATWRNPKGALEFPYLVPAGPYQQCWDWDSVFLGVATLPFGAGQFFTGSMMNFFAATNLSTGGVSGCLTVSLPTRCSSSTKYHDALHHAKPILIQGAWLAAAYEGSGSDPASFVRFKPAMEALLAFWDRSPRRDPLSGLRTWHDQMESGADNCVLSRCPNARSSCWTESQAYTLASADVITMLQREHVAFALFSESWASVAANQSDYQAAETHRLAAAKHRAAADSLATTLNAQLWREDLGYHQAWNVSAKAPIESRTYVMGFPLWAGLVNQSQAAKIAATLSQPDMLAADGLRSTSSDDPRYSNADEIVPYSNCEGTPAKTICGSRHNESFFLRLWHADSHRACIWCLCGQ
eukprot:COSAG02_NODE_166_length_31947_cov_34.168617_15_plen_398_part_00